MKKRLSRKNLAAVVGTAVAATFSLGSVANAGQNPFGMTDLSNGYMEVAEGEKKMEGTCGESKCGGEMKKKTEMEQQKKAEGSCGEGKCGEGKCAGAKKKDSTEGSSDESMKGGTAE